MKNLILVFTLVLGILSTSVKGEEVTRKLKLDDSSWSSFEDYEKSATNRAKDHNYNDSFLDFFISDNAKERWALAEAFGRAELIAYQNLQKLGKDGQVTLVISDTEIAKQMEKKGKKNLAIISAIREERRELTISLQSSVRSVYIYFMHYFEEQKKRQEQDRIMFANEHVAEIVKEAGEKWGEPLTQLVLYRLINNTNLMNKKGRPAGTIYLTAEDYKEIIAEIAEELMKGLGKKIAS